MAYDATLVTADGFAVTPNDNTAVTAYGFYVGSVGGGTSVVIKTLLGTQLTFTVAVGTEVRIGISRFMSATTASNIVAFGPT